MGDDKSGKSGVRIEWIKLSGAIVALLAAIIGLIISIINFSNIAKQEKKSVLQQEELAKQQKSSVLQQEELAKQQKSIERFESCYGEVIINIIDPQDGDQVSSSIDIKGTATIHDRCRYVFIVVRDKNSQVWRVTDLLQVNINGTWAGKAKLDDIPVGGEAEISAIIIAQPKAYPVGEHFSVPPDRGVPSNFVCIKRIN
ncbi:MAG: hypothetical protein HYR55_01970 [Acidobacteria bacterium]|nr:hypothetical protein [Acidobacteriota bacterium]MBI3655371.1 hypothetical protein [Acidobacteriota bacterium]